MMTFEQCFQLLIVCYGNVNTVYLCIRAFHVNNSCNLKFSSKHEEHIMFMILEMLDMYKVQCLQMVDLGFENMNKQFDKIGSHAVVDEVCQDCHATLGGATVLANFVYDNMVFYNQFC